MIRLAILALILALILAGCGHHSHHQAKPPTAPPSTAFADVAGTYLATVTANTGVYLSTAVNETFTITVVPDGTATAVNRLRTATIVYHLTRKTDGTFGIQPRSLPAGNTEFATAPADLSTLHLYALDLWAGFPDQGEYVGGEDLIMVKIGST